MVKLFAFKSDLSIDIVRAGIGGISHKGSFTLVSGILGGEFTDAPTIGATVNAYACF